MPLKQRDPQWFEDGGQWCAFTIGEFISLMVDGSDKVVLAKILEKSPVNEQGFYTMRMEIILVPDGLVQETVENTGCHLGDSRFCQVMQEGLLR